MSSYTFDGTTVNIPKGQKILIPVLAIHRDPNFYPKPDIFDPERFNDEAVQARHPMCYLPFGDGPRNCIGKVKDSKNLHISISFEFRLFCF